MRQDIDMNMDFTNTMMCDSAGNLLFYTNGEKIYKSNHTLMQNGNGIATNGDGYGYRLPRALLHCPNRAAKPCIICLM